MIFSRPASRDGLFRTSRVTRCRDRSARVLILEVTRVVDVVNEQRLAELALTTTASQLARMIAGFRSADGMRIGQQAKRNLSWHEHTDGMINFRVRLPKEEAALLVAAIGAAKDQFALAPGTPVLATTATANQRVSVDVARQLGEDTVTLRGSLSRSSLRLAVVPHLRPLERYAWVAEALRSLPGSGIVYVLTVAETERVAGFLLEQGLEVAAYSGQTTNRVELEDRLRDNTIKALVATSALGMGYDKPDLAFCIHLGSPASPVAYYQQVGRAGRALEDAQAILVPTESDERIWDYFATSGIPDEQQVERILDALGDSVQSLAGLEAATG
ncbi:MAG TPA: helicase-related protein, partial [Propionibacteriaceae bacterium]